MKERVPVFRMVLPLTLCQGTYKATQTDFFYVVERAAHSIKHETGRHWRVDGHTSDTLHLRLSCERLNLGVDFLKQDIGFQVGSGNVTVRLMSRLPSVHDLVDQFTRQPGLYVPRQAA